MRQPAGCSQQDHRLAAVPMLATLSLSAYTALLGREALVPQRVAPPVMKLADDGILGVGVIGAGRIGIVHLEALSQCESAKAVIISNPTVSKAEKAAKNYRLAAFTGDAMEVINHPEVEAVWICMSAAN